MASHTGQLLYEQNRNFGTKLLLLDDGSEIFSGLKTVLVPKNGWFGGLE
jgi:hypothetical protein